MNVGCSTVHRIMHSIGPSLPKSLGGRPATLTPYDQQLLTQKVTSGAADTAPQLKKLLDLDVSTQTIRRSLRKAGLKAAVKPKEPFLSKAHQKQQLEFALEHQHWTLDDWSRVVWSGQMRPRLIGGVRWEVLGMEKAWICAERAACQWDSKIWGWIPNGLGLHDTSRSGVHVQDRWENGC